MRVNLIGHINFHIPLGYFDLGAPGGPSIPTQFGFTAPAPIETPPYVGKDDDTVFQSILVLHESALLKREEFEEIVCR